MTHNYRIAIDGPAAAGKSTVAKILAEKLSYIYIDTGAMYRALTYKALQAKADLQNEKMIADILHATEINLEPGKKNQLVLLDGENITEDIRSHEVTNSVSHVAKHGLVREEMVKRQQQLAEKGKVVMDGRDIGTHVIPDAEIKVFLLASVEERAKRRHEENISKGFSSNIENLKEEISKRDKLDSERKVAPLRKAADATEIDTTSLNIQGVVDRIMTLVLERNENK
ncbi:(d)CMP kinase [Bacillus sp. 2205SS5-2]|uniref:(d)CMP kinase n=1 Tax=Bacillus sp. 2205SS5-2 TaxID=3109031 RepID=UPI00300651CD